MQADQRYKQWIDSKRPPDVLPDFTDAVMQYVRMHAQCQRSWRLDVLIDRIVGSELVPDMYRLRTGTPGRRGVAARTQSWENGPAIESAS